MKSIQLAITAAALLTFSLSPVRASLTWDFSYVDTATDGTLIQASGTLTTSDILTANIGGFGVSGYEVTSISGFRNGLAITGLASNPNFPAAVQIGNVILDNGLITSPPQFDNNGLSFWVGSDEYNLFSQIYPLGGGYFEDANGTGTGDYIPVTLTLGAVPEASTIIAGALLLLPFGANTLRILRRNRTA
jgi:hypothetical protein